MVVSGGDATPCGDNVLGPTVDNGCRGGFDFTLLFEQAILSLAPTAIFLLMALVRILQLRSQPAIRIQKWLLVSKQSSILVLSVLQLTLLIQWTRAPRLQTTVTLADCAVCFVAFLLTGLLSHLEHCRSPRPSTLLNVYFLYSLLSSAVIIRTLWLVPSNAGITALSTGCLALKLVVLIFESLECHALPRLAPGSTSESRSGIMTRSIFMWLNPLLRAGYRSVLSLQDLFEMESAMQCEQLRGRIERVWANGKASKSSNGLLFTILKTFKFQIARAILPRCFLAALQLSQPYLIARVIDHLSSTRTESSHNSGYGLIVASALIYTGIAISTGLYWHCVYRMVTSIRGGVVSLLYAKTLLRESHSSSESAALTLMVTDIEKVMLGFEDIHEIWANVLSVAVATWLLSIRLSWACIAPIVFSLVCIAIMLWLSGSVNSSQLRWVKAIQTRVETTAKALGQMREIKLLGWAPRMSTSLKDLRQQEVDASGNFRLLIVWNIFLSQVPSFGAASVAFAFYMIVEAARDQKGFLNASSAFNSLSLIMLLTSPLALIIQAIPNLASAVGCLNRMQEFLASDEQIGLGHKRVSSNGTSLEKQRDMAEYATETFEKVSDTARSDSIVACREASFAWTNDGSGVHAINLDVKAGGFVVLVGPVGSGKSTLLQGLLGETPVADGQTEMKQVGIAYCAQTPWLQNTSVRSNIIGADSYDSAWYGTVTRACCLDTDFSQWPLGDATLVGSGGVALSGGQQQRIALARAVFSRKDLVLLDDVLSGLDSHTKSRICKNVLGKSGLLENHGRTRILATHYNGISDADCILALDQSGRASPQEARKNSSPANADVVDIKGDDDADVAADAGICRQSDEAPSTPVSNSTKDAERSKDLLRRNGDWSIYKYYFNASGWLHLAIFLLVGVLFAFCQSFQPVWLDLWSSADTAYATSHLGLFLGIYFALVIIGLLALWWSCKIFLVSMVNQSANWLHAVLVDTVTAAPLSFFVKTDTGAITNRFSQDMTLVDYNLPMAGANVGLTGLTAIAQLIVVAAVSTFMACTVPFCFLALYAIQKVYLKTSRQLRLLDLETKSPLYSNSIETVDGLVTIRAFGWQSRFQALNDRLLDASQRPLYLLYSIQRWLQFVLDMLVAVLVTVTVALAVLLVGKTGAPSAGGTGVALTSLVSFNVTIAILIRFWTSMETSLGAIARIRDFAMSTAREDPDVGRLSNLVATQSIRASIELKDVSVAYGDRPALSHISLQIAVGERVGICGRSGSGKSTLLALLLRLIDPNEGKVLMSDVDTALLPRNQVQSTFNIVTQKPAFLNGSIRENLDPDGAIKCDEAIGDMLIQAGLWDEVVSQGGLDAAMSEGKWSAGQRQILCLVRAMLRAKAAPILVLDEAMSNVDANTEAVMQRLIDTHVAGCTIIAVAHRLTSIRHFDKVAVLDDGKLLEYDHPNALLQRNDSAFKSLWSNQNNNQV